jgi:NAD(P)H-nitrite reductase large subunit
MRIFIDQHLIELKDGSHIGYDRLLIATGASAARSAVPGANLQGVVKLDNLEDARRILSLARRRRVAVVVGGGITALEIVEGLVAKGVKTHYFLRRDRYWHNVLDETESRIV